MNITKEQVRATLDLMITMTELIRELGEVPNGVLYARVMDTLDIRTYNLIIDRIKSTGLVVEKFNLLIWTGPMKGVRR